MTLHELALYESTEPRWEFWIDVGGTFTDVLAKRPDGCLVRHKLLSTGITKGALADGSSATCIVDLARRADPDGFWSGYGLKLLDSGGHVVGAGIVKRFDRAAGELWICEPLTGLAGAGLSYELVADEEAPLLGIRYILGLSRNAPIPPALIKLGTTKGTNALLTRRGAACALVTTRGFADVLRIGYQNRPRLFDLNIRKPAPLFVATAEIDERLAADGEVLKAPDYDQVRTTLVELFDRSIRSLAICLLHSYRFPQHELFVESVARDLGFQDISRSSEVAPFIKIVSRGDTTVVDAYLNPVLRTYIQRLRAGFQGEVEQADGSAGGQDWVDLRLLTSAGGLVDAGAFHGKDSILSGPAGGVVGSSRVALAAGFTRSIGFDMGGTSTDVSRFDGRYEREYETQKAGVRIVAPMLAIETVAAGGGSLCWFDGVKLCVGPDSAGADPGPACYGCGGPLAVTDLNLFLGKLVAEFFPFPLDPTAVRRRLEETRDAVAQATGQKYDLVELADGFLRPVANARMAQAIRSISIAKGYAPRDYVLVPFGGAAGQHACAIAAELEMTQILCHPDAGLLSAYGIGLADVTRHRAAGIYRRYDETALEELAKTFEQLAREALAELEREGVDPQRRAVRRALDMRYLGTDIPLTVPEPADGNYERAFTGQHRQLYGYTHPNRGLEIVAARVEATGLAETALATAERATRHPAPANRKGSAFFNGREYPAGIFRREQLEPGHLIAGPAIVLEQTSTTVIDPGWLGEVLSGGELLLDSQPRDADNSPAGGDASLAFLSRQMVTPTASDAVSSHSGINKFDPVSLEIFHNHFGAIAEQMGITLRNTSSSVNVKERLDFSCALFTASGDLVVNAPHIPVHLGAMGETVKQVIRDNPTPRPGDVFVTNDPYHGGSHLPDITVVTPVCAPETERLMFFTASRAHHAEIGGVTPGSMPPFSRSLAEEGVLIRNFKLVDGGQSRLDELQSLLAAGPHPSRNVADNLYDISAQVAANQQGNLDLLRLVARHGWPTVAAYMQHIQDAAERKMRTALKKLPAGRRKFVDHLDDGSPIAVTVDIQGETALLDFSGTGPVLAGNLNANRAIVTAAVMYCMRCLIDEDIPLNQGVLAPIKILLPECLLNPPRKESAAESAAVAGGNVETSQRVVDVLLGALGLAAASQGTMNNLLFGDGSFGYYETICGGAGATLAGPGADAVHTHMTNTRLTDPEVLEHRYPVRLREFRVRLESGGAGRHRGGDGVLRRIEFLRPLEVSILSQRRGPFRPYGLEGGMPGALGINSLSRVDGTCEELPGMTQCRVSAGDVLTIQTPGGGGWGAGDRMAPPVATDHANQDMRGASRVRTIDSR